MPNGQTGAAVKTGRSRCVNTMINECTGAAVKTGRSRYVSTMVTEGSNSHKAMNAKRFHWSVTTCPKRDMVADADV